LEKIERFFQALEKVGLPVLPASKDWKFWVGRASPSEPLFLCGGSFGLSRHSLLATAEEFALPVFRTLETNGVLSGDPPPRR